jgi:hypothetical protein
MFWDLNKSAARALLCSVAAMGSIAIASPALAQSLVVRSTGPSAAQYPAGKKIAASGKITLKRGDRITVLDKGKTRVLTGPGTFSLSRKTSASQTSNRVASFVATGPRRRARTGAVRGAGTKASPADATLAARSPNLWFVDVSRGGTHCVVKPEQILLWRPEVRSDQTMILANASGGQADITWRRGSPLRRWPTDKITVLDDGRYTMGRASDAQSIAVTVKLLPETPKGLDAMAEALLANGCNQQLDLLVDILAANEATDIDGAASEEGSSGSGQNDQ